MTGFQNSLGKRSGFANREVGNKTPAPLHHRAPAWRPPESSSSFLHTRRATDCWYSLPGTFASEPFVTLNHEVATSLSLNTFACFTHRPDLAIELRALL